MRNLVIRATVALACTVLAGTAAAQDQIVPEFRQRPPSGAGVPVDTVVLQGLDKITARISTFQAPFNQPVRFGSLEITARTCHKTPPEEPPERAAFLEIVDVRPDSPSVTLFTGWMFASSPALSSLEHPVYDVWVVDCILRGDGNEESAPAAVDESSDGSVTIEMEPQAESGDAPAD